MRRIATPLGVVAAALIALLLPAAAGAAAAFGPSTSFGGSNSFGAPGTGDGQFNHPQAVAINLGNGNVYVADTGNGRVQRFGSGGNFLGKFATNTPQDIAIAPGGSVYVASPTRVDAFTSAGVPLIGWNLPAGSVGYGIAIDSSGNVYVSDTQNSQILEYTNLGGFVKGFSGAGSDPGELLQPKGMTVDSSNHLYVADPSNGRIEAFTAGASSGTFLGQWSMPGYTVYAGGVSFPGVVRPQDVAVDGSGRVFAPDTGTHSNLIAVFGSDGTLQQLFGTPDSDPANGCTLSSPWGVSTSPSGALYVASTGENKMRVFDESDGACPSPNFGSAPSGGGSGGGPTPADIASDRSKPRITMRGIPKKCARRDFIIRIHAQDDLLINRLQLYVNHKRETNDEIKQQQFDFRVHIPVRRVRRQIPRGFVVKVLFGVRVTDYAGHKTNARRSFRICG